MIRVRRGSVAVLLFAVFLASPDCALGWGNIGHEAVACFAWKHLPQVTKDKVWLLLQRVPSLPNNNGGASIRGFKEWSENMPTSLSEDEQHMYVFMRAATWADSVRHKSMHGSNAPSLNMAESTSKIGFADSGSHGRWHFVDIAFGTVETSYSTPPAVPKRCWTRRRDQAPAPPTPAAVLPPPSVPNAVSEIARLASALANDKDPTLKAYDMIWLEHLVGDVHQPLHASVRFVRGIGDVGANCVAISLTGEVRSRLTAFGYSAKSPAELHAFWDDLPGIGSQLDTQPAVDYAATLPEPDAAMADISDPNIWAKESFDMAVKDAYSVPVGPELGATAPYKITLAYYQVAASDAKKRIVLAGFRLAELLTRALQ